MFQLMLERNERIILRNAWSTVAYYIFNSKSALTEHILIAVTIIAPPTQNFLSSFFVLLRTILKTLTQR